MASYFVDPSIATNTGAGTLADPWGSTSDVLHRALDSLITRNATTGDVINVKAGTACVLSKNLSVAVYGTPTQTARLTIRGYTTTEKDGGKGLFNGNALYGFVNSTLDYIDLIDLDISNTGAAEAIYLDRYINIIRCKITCPGTMGIRLGLVGDVVGNEVACSAVGSVGIYVGQYTSVIGNWVNITSSTTGTALYPTGEHVFFSRNISTLTGTNAAGMYLAATYCRIINNSFLATGANVNRGIQFVTTQRVPTYILNNIIEGFSGAGGDGIDFASSIDDLVLYANNAFFNNTANETGKGTCQIDEGNESLSISGFEKSGANTFANRFVYFAPVATGNLRGGSWGETYLDKGAVQHADPASGGGIIVPRLRNIY